MSAVFSPCRTWRYQLHRDVQMTGKTWALLGINPSDAGEDVDDQSVRKVNGFALRNGVRDWYFINPFGAVSRDVKRLAAMTDPVGEENDAWILRTLTLCDEVVPCYGNRSKVPRRLHARIDRVLTMIRDCGKPVRVFGLTKSGDPMHPLWCLWATTTSLKCSALLTPGVLAGAMAVTSGCRMPTSRIPVLSAIFGCSAKSKTRDSCKSGAAFVSLARNPRRGSWCKVQQMGFHWSMLMLRRVAAPFTLHPSMCLWVTRYPAFYLVL
jgi:hypothetical protein